VEHWHVDDGAGDDYGTDGDGDGDGDDLKDYGGDGDGDCVVV